MADYRFAAAAAQDLSYRFSAAAAQDLSYASCAESIMAFDIKAEELSIMPHAGAGATPNDHDHRDQDWSKNGPGHLRMDPLAMDGFLSLAELQSLSLQSLCQAGFVIKVWRERLHVYSVAVVDGD